MPADILSFAMLSDPGRVRRHNEDACAAAAEMGAFVVCDGVGGAASGEVASHLAAESFLALIASAFEERAPLDEAVVTGVHYANDLVYRKSQQMTVMRGMATTLVALVFERPTATSPLSDVVVEDGDHLVGELLGESRTSPATAWLANVGDSRCYLLRQGVLQQLTHDHSLVEEQVRAGELTRAQADLSPVRNVITRAVGSDAAVEADVQGVPVSRGDLYLLCSDGLVRDLKNDEIAAILLGSAISSDAELAIACERLVEAANEKGGGDNITCLLVSIA